MMQAEETAPRTTATSRLKPIMRGFVVLFAVIGMLTTVNVVIGLAADISSFDETSGGYDYPFEGWTGTPYDYDAMYITSEGLFKRGRVIDLYFNCETGMITYRAFGLISGDFREFSDRAIVVHQPHIACRERGFDTSAWDSIDDPDGLFPELSS